ncbi:hypothetical protein M413DRAFT_144946 [Hebeloma cylindrosporum]|uniref:Uncharacterized protein n=1 Tax=Hebeloma cylindrosporum TaxID=76867 RepID=A0A0C3CCB6_HEBCY|nr:hypothetical protein M413DRAFT_144946 [Hebeloma cylindrosporum h7]
MIRPAPLQLKLDNRFPHPIRTPSQPKSQSFASQLYKASWKNPIIAVAGLNALRYAFAAQNAFQDAIVDDSEDAQNLLKVSLALGAMYMFAFFIEIYGITGVSLQRLGLIRGYLYLTFFASLLVTGAAVIRGISYFTFAEELVLECVSLAMEGRAYEKSVFRSRPWPGSVFATEDKFARKQCVYAWVHQSWSQVASVFIFGFIPSVIHYIMVYTYYRQTIDPKHPANLQHNHPLFRGARGGGRGGGGGGGGSSREAGYSQLGYSRVGANDGDHGSSSSTGHLAVPPHPSARLRTGATRRSQQQTQNNTRSQRGVGASSSSNQGNTSKRTFTSRSLQRSHRPPPLIQSPSPVGFTPGPPSYNKVNNRSRVYAAFAAPVPSDSEYDKFV